MSGNVRFAKVEWLLFIALEAEYILLLLAQQSLELGLQIVHSDPEIAHGLQGLGTAQPRVGSVLPGTRVEAGPGVGGLGRGVVEGVGGVGGHIQEQSSRVKLLFSAHYLYGLGQVLGELRLPPLRVLLRRGWLRQLSAPQLVHADLFQ